ncbi:hypothetical protein BD777DRAFT_137014 [Yarrowia lipolytica]|nr:hypothetical protein BD777DRAFT_137014 [Yarrowia lipolytica]
MRKSVYRTIENQFKSEVRPDYPYLTTVYKYPKGILQFSGPRTRLKLILERSNVLLSLKFTIEDDSMKSADPSESDTFPALGIIRKNIEMSGITITCKDVIYFPVHTVVRFWPFLKNMLSKNCLEIRHDPPPSVSFKWMRTVQGETTRRAVKGWNERKLVELYLDTIEIFR